ncbi:hypothetical protein ENBRE01_2486 [Enteropsectra breve]|nr:hypothetical protein ENBRE01_2486 [Enteropsectra breve]
MTSNKRKLLKLEEKKNIIREIENGTKQSSLVLRGIATSSVISRIWKNRRFISEAHAVAPSTRMKIKSTVYKELDEKLLLWFREMRLANIPLSSPILAGKANEIALKNGFVEFKCSTGWINRFKARHSITFGKICGESQGADRDIVDKWLFDEWPQIRTGYAD